MAWGVFTWTDCPIICVSVFNLSWTLVKFDPLWEKFQRVERLLSSERAPLLPKLGQAFSLQVSVRHRNASFPAMKGETMQYCGPGVFAAVLHAEHQAHLERSSPFGIYCTFIFNLPVSMEIKNSLCEGLRLLFVSWLFLRFFSSLAPAWEFLFAFLFLFFLSFF